MVCWVYPQENCRTETTGKSLAHSRWECKYHVVFIPKYRRKVLYGEIRASLGGIFHELAKQKEYRIVEGHLLADHVHMCIEIPPKYGKIGSSLSFCIRVLLPQPSPFLATCYRKTWLLLPLKERGDARVMGVSLEVADLEAAAERVG